MLIIGLIILALLVGGSIRKDFVRYPMAARVVWIITIVAIYHYW